MRRFPLLPLSFTIFLAACSGQKYAEGNTDGPSVYKAACMQCHGAEGIPARSLVVRIGVRPLNNESLREWSDEKIRQQILKGSPKRTMPGFEGSLSKEQIDALITHIRSLKAP